MKSSLHIHQLKTRYHLRPSVRDSRERLDRLLQQVLDQALEEALAEAGVRPEEELCVRELRTLVELRLGQTDQALIEAWSRALARAIRQAADVGTGIGIVRYASRLHALIDFACGITRGRMQRAWAWKQLGFVDTDEPAHSEVTAGLVWLLEREPTLLIPLLRALADLRQLLPLAERLDSSDWQRLGRVAWQVAGGAGEPPLEFSPPHERNKKMSMTLQQTETVRQDPSPGVIRLLRLSSIAEAVLEQPDRFASTSVPLAVLAAMIGAEVEPSRLAGPRAKVESWLAAIMHELARLGGGDTAAWRAWSAETPSENKSAAAADRVTDHKTSRTPHMDDEEIPGAGTENSSATVGPAGIASTSDTDAETEQQGSPSPGLQPADPLLSEPPPAPGREAVITSWGGLFYLLNPIDELELPTFLLNDAHCGERPLGWLLERLLVQLVPAAEGDVAATALAGVAPGADWPWSEEPLATPAEALILDDAGRKITALLSERLDWRAGQEALQLELVSRRQATLEVEPGWLDVVFPLTELATEIRRAALDLDPGYLSWQGRVVRFRYE